MNRINILDGIIVFAYLIGVLMIGIFSRRFSKTQEGFFLGNRRFGKFISTFLSFGAGTNPDTAIATSRETYRQGLSGIWINFLFLFITPFYWFFAKWFRRVRVTTPGDILYQRYQSRWLSGAYALVSILMFASVNAIMFTGVGKTIESLTPKSIAKYSIEEQMIVQEYRDMVELKNRLNTRNLTDEELKRLQDLMKKESMGILKPTISLVSSKEVVPIMAMTVLVYTIIGGLSAAAYTDIFQGILIIILSFILLPTGLTKAGGFSGLHARLPDHFFHIFGSITRSEYTLPYIFSIVFLNLAGYLAQPQNITTAGGAAKDERTAQISFVSGSLMKRFCTILWALTGIVGFALFSQEVSDPDMIWGYMSLQLLGNGLIGVMIVCLLAAMMSTTSAYMLSGGALITKNLYLPLFPQKSEKHYLLVGKIGSALIVFLGMALSLKFNDILSIMKQIWILPILFGPAFWLAIVWRRTTTKAVWVGVIFSFLFTFLGPNFLSTVNWISKNPTFIQETKIQYIPTETRTDREDLAPNHTDESGQPAKTHFVIHPTPIYFEKIVHENPYDSQSPLKGTGNFRLQILILKWLGLNVSTVNKSQLNTYAFLFDATIPFLLIIFISFMTRPNDKKVLDKFYARLHTPVYQDQQKDRTELNKSYRNPNRWKNQKILAESSIELLKPNRKDISGLIISSVFVLAIVGFLFLVSKLQWP